MANPFYQNFQKSTLPNVNNSMNQFKNMYKLLVNSKNPMGLFTSLAVKNPQMRPILDMLNNGSSPQNVFNALCTQRGIDPNEFLRNLIQ